MTVSITDDRVVTIELKISTFDSPICISRSYSYKNQNGDFGNRIGLILDFLICSLEHNLSDMDKAQLCEALENITMQLGPEIDDLDKPQFPLGVDYHPESDNGIAIDEPTVEDDEDALKEDPPTEVQPKTDPVTADVEPVYERAIGDMFQDDGVWLRVTEGGCYMCHYNDKKTCVENVTIHGFCSSLKRTDETGACFIEDDVETLPKPQPAETSLDIEGDFIVTRSPEYFEGATAYLDGYDKSSCPYPPRQGFNNQRYQWFAGWLQARTQVKFPHMFGDPRQ